eukprot:TRINITY_DN40357_c0_g1_i1.p1 TRINITY_DN40357_c0_g1~~TRINITY_DN40357_c0_g1_i1.p1  ORF type:complete len:429 (+),score=77.11 TRINITY_DN40357_c0_g1_i1:111-1397(+)
MLRNWFKHRWAKTSQGTAGPLFRALAGRHAPEAWLAGPSGFKRWPMAPQTAAGYSGGCDTPNWLLSNAEGDGNDVMEQFRSLFKPFAPTSKDVIARYKVRVAPGKASAGPPIGQIFSGVGIKSMDFVKEFNAATIGVFHDDPELVLKTYIHFYSDKTFQWRINPPPTSWLIRKAAGLPRISVAGFGCGKAIGSHSPNQYEGYITIQTLYHIAAIQNTWESWPDRVPIERRVMDMVSNARKQGLCLLGVDTPPMPELGMTDDEITQMYHEKAEEWLEKTHGARDADPTGAIPWYPKTWYNVEGFDRRRPGDSFQSNVVKDAQVIDKKFQKLLEEKDKERLPNYDAVGREDPIVDWNFWKTHGYVSRDLGKGFHMQPLVRRTTERYVNYIRRKHPGAMPRTRVMQSMWHASDYDKYLPVNEYSELQSRVR